MKSMTKQGYVLVRGDGGIMDWTFNYYRRDAVSELTKHSQKTWEQWRKEGIRCVKATSTVTIEL